MPKCLIKQSLKNRRAFSYERGVDVITVVVVVIDLLLGLLFLLLLETFPPNLTHYNKIIDQTKQTFFLDKK
jgi:hypothetical protein